MKRLITILQVIVVAVGGALVTRLVFWLPQALLEKAGLDTVPYVWDPFVGLTFACVIFSFVFSGCLATPRRWRTSVGMGLSLLVIAIVLSMWGDSADSVGGWAFVSCFLGAGIGITTALLSQRRYHGVA